jgi:hypothetical protein
MENGVGTTGHAFDTDLSGGGVKQCQHLGCAIFHVFMGVTLGFTLWYPRTPSIGFGLEWAGFVLGPGAQTQGLAAEIG